MVDYLDLIDLNNEGNSKNDSNQQTNQQKQDVKRDDKKDKLKNILNLNELKQELRTKSTQNVITNYEQHLLNELIELNSSTNLQFDLLTNCGLSNDELKDQI